MTTLEKVLFETLLEVMDAVWTQASNEPEAPAPAPAYDEAA